MVSLYPDDFGTPSLTEMETSIKDEQRILLKFQIAK